MKSSSQDNRSDRLSIIYDGECPFCANFVKLYAIRFEKDRMRLKVPVMKAQAPACASCPPRAA